MKKSIFGNSLGANWGFSLSQFEYDEMNMTLEKVARIIEQDSQLPENIRAREGQSLSQIEDISCVLLTGATGGLGAYVLRELCNLPQILTIYCLVRSSKTKKASVRLKECLAEKGLLDQIPMMKVAVIDGDVARSHFGIGEGAWKNITNLCGAVIHCAASVNHVELVSLEKGQSSTVREVNIAGMNHVLEFACAGRKVKHVYYASSGMACGRGRSENGVLSEEWPNLEDFKNVTPFAYPVSKFCGDMLLKEACLGRGIPCKSFRFPYITGDSVTGQFSVDKNHLMLKYFYMMKREIMPSIPLPMQILPVDICAKVSVALFFSKDVPPNVYNIFHPSPAVDEEFVGLASKFGGCVELVEFARFTERLRQETDNSTQMTLFKKAYHDDGMYMNHYYAMLGGWMDNRKEFWKSKKLEKYIPDFFPSLESTLEYLERDMKFAEGQGWLQRFGI